MTRAARAWGSCWAGESFHEFLGRCEPTYRVGRWVAENLPATARLIGQDHRGFYIPRGYTMELAHRRRTGLGPERRIAARDRRGAEERGIHARLALPADRRAGVEFDPTLGRLLAPWLAAQTPLYREDLADADGVVRRYAIYELLRRESAAHA